MVTYERYSNLSDLPRRYRKRAKSKMFDDETFVQAIDTKSGRIRSKHNPKLILTDNRIIRLKSGMVRSESEDYQLAEITSIQFNRGMRTSKIKLQGSAIDDDYKVTKRLGQPFTSAVREQMANKQTQ
ncbi:PH domain-containing protein [Natrinema sp. LN54]|uniref:PH domain-containing protein n=1 Tax=Natrinema sp. LN54 TaxID=3458705 RepID=UPI004036D204